MPTITVNRPQANTNISVPVSVRVNKAVNNRNELFDIDPSIRFPGFRAYQENAKQFWTLSGGIENKDWEKIDPFADKDSTNWNLTEW